MKIGKCLGGSIVLMLTLDKCIKWRGNLYIIAASNKIVRVNQQFCLFPHQYTQHSLQAECQKPELDRSFFDCYYHPQIFQSQICSNLVSCFGIKLQLWDNTQKEVEIFGFIQCLVFHLPLTEINHIVCIVFYFCLLTETQAMIIISTIALYIFYEH